MFTDQKWPGLLSGLGQDAIQCTVTPFGSAVNVAEPPGSVVSARAAVGATVATAIRMPAVSKQRRVRIGGTELAGGTRRDYRQPPAASRPPPDRTPPRAWPTRSTASGLQRGQLV